MSAPRWAQHVRAKVRDAEQWIRPSAFGAVDGLVTNALLVFGTSLTGASPHEIVAAGVTGLAAAPVAQAVGEGVSMSDENQVKLRKAERQAGAGGEPPRLNSPTTAAVSAWAAASTGAFAPIVPYMAGAASPLWALGVGAAGLAAAGVASTKVTGRRWWQGATRYLAAGGIGGSVSYLGDNAEVVARHPALLAAGAVGGLAAAQVGGKWRRRRAERAARTAGESRESKPRGPQAKQGSRGHEGGRDRSGGRLAHRLRSARATTGTRTNGKPDRRRGHAR
ncbi:MAG TPA: VIT1/CCC1 transporter family protein [Streptosporangiales bacterium]